MKNLISRFICWYRGYCLCGEHLEFEQLSHSKYKCLKCGAVQKRTVITNAGPYVSGGLNPNLNSYIYKKACEYIFNGK